MLHNVYLFHNFPHLVLVSSLIFVFLNIVENIIHYNIGLHASASKSNNEEIHDAFHVPSFKDAIKITVVMIVFALLQGIFTYVLMKYT